MAQNITLLGASYSAVPAVVLPKTGGGTARFDDASITTATASDVLQGKLFLSADGTITEGTNSGGGSGGDSAWTKVAETSYQVSTTNTYASMVATWATGHSEIWTAEKYVLIRIRDTAGKRNGYLYGCDCFFINDGALTASTTCTNMVGSCFNYDSSVFGHRYIYNTSGYGVYADYLYSDGKIRIRTRYNSAYTKTINGTYKVEVYLLDPPTGAPIFT